LLPCTCQLCPRALHDAVPIPSGMFPGAFSSARAVLPMTGYYEWVEAAAGGKDPFFIHHPEGQLLHAAGLTAARKDEADVWDISFTVITREARDAGGEVHDRMPAFLTEDALEEWLSPRKLEDDQKAPLLAQLEPVPTAVARQRVSPPADRQGP